MFIQIVDESVSLFLQLNACHSACVSVRKCPGTRHTSGSRASLRAAVREFPPCTLRNAQALHSRGENGSVRMDSLLVIQRAFTKVEFFVYGSG
jgi:hypothetical protein